VKAADTKFTHPMTGGTGGAGADAAGKGADGKAADMLEIK